MTSQILLTSWHQLLASVSPWPGLEGFGKARLAGSRRGPHVFRWQLLRSEGSTQTNGDIEGPLQGIRG